MIARFIASPSFGSSHSTAVTCTYNAPDNIYMHSHISPKKSSVNNYQFRKLQASCHSGYSLVPASLVMSPPFHMFMLQVFTVSSSSGSSFRQAGYEVSDILCLEYTFQLGPRTVFAVCGRTVFVLFKLGLGRHPPAQEAPSLARSVRCRWYRRLIVTILTNPRFLWRPHWRWGWIRVILPPFGPSEQRIDCGDRRGHQTYTDLHV